MIYRFTPPLRMLLAGVALGAIVPLAACNQAIPEQAAYKLPDLPATLPLALGEQRPLVYAPAATELPRVRQIKAARVAEPDDYYAYAEDAWSYYDALGDAPPDYGFYYDDIEPWAWQGYDDSLMFVEPLDDGYRYYYYRADEEYPYFIRDPDYGYGYNDGLLAVIYDALGGIVPYDDYYDEPYLDWASSYYDRGYRLYWASRDRHPVIAASWYDVQPAYSLAYLDWEEDLWRQQDWYDYHNRTYDLRSAYWEQERARREAEAIRYAAWQDYGFQTLAPPRAIPANWEPARWAQDERYYVPAVSGFTGDTAQVQRAALRERQRVESLARTVDARQAAGLADLRQRVRARPEADERRADRIAEARQRLERRQVQVAAREDRQSGRELARLERQQRALERVEQRAVRTARADPREKRGPVADADARIESRKQDVRARVEQWQRREAQAPAREQVRQQRDDRSQARAQAEQRRQQQVEARQQVGREREDRSQLRAQAEQRRQLDQAREQQRRQREERAQSRAQAEQRQVQAREQTRQQQAARSQARAEAEQRRQSQAEAGRQRAAQEADRAARRDQARQAAEQRRAQADQARQQQQQQAQAQANAQRDQARQQAEQQRAARDQARQAAQQQQAQQAQQQAQADAGQNGNGKGRKDRAN